MREHTANGKQVMEHRLDPAAMWGAPWLLNHRVTLHKQLLANATADDGTVPGKPPRILLGKKVVSANVENTSVTLDDGSVMKADVLIAADGIRSVIQREVIGDSLVAKPSGHSAYRCLIPGEPIKADPEWSYLFETSGCNIFLADDRRVVAYTCAYQGRDYINIVAACPDQSLSEGVDSKESWSERGSVAELVKTFSDFSPAIQRLLSYSEECGLWQLRDQDPLKNWHKNQTVLIGDAAHPMLPHLGQGGSQAIEDADMLGYVLKDLDSTASAHLIQQRLQKFFTLRWPRATFCQENSRSQALGHGENDAELGVPILNPLKTAQYLYTYEDGEAWDAQQAEEAKTKSSSMIEAVDKSVSVPPQVAQAVAPQVATI